MLRLAARLAVSRESAVFFVEDAEMTSGAMPRDVSYEAPPVRDRSAGPMFSLVTFEGATARVMIERRGASRRRPERGA